MDLNANGKHSGIPPEELLNVFALVVYIPGPLGVFLDELRRELVPHYNPHAHVSVLPPRCLANCEEWTKAREGARTRIEAWTPFRVEATEIKVFPSTNVIYIELGAGDKEFRRMHENLNSDLLEHEEVYDFEPHITLAQEIEPERVDELKALARLRWQEYKGERSFLADRAMFVRNTVDNRWLDLAEFEFRAVPAQR